MSGVQGLSKPSSDLTNIPRVRIAIALGIAAVCLGEISVYLSVPPDRFVPVWIVAALAVTLPWIWGRVMALPLALGTGLVGLDLSLRLFHMDWPPALILSACLTLSSLVQSELGLQLLRRKDRGRYARQDQLNDIAHLVGIVGPLCALPMAVLFPAGVALGPLVPDAGYWGIGFRSWLSSLLGIVAFAPLCLVIFGPAPNAWRRKLALALPTGILLIVLTIVFVFTRMDGVGDRREAFRALTAEDRQSLEDELNGVERRLLELGGLFEASETVTAEELSTFESIAFVGLPPDRIVRWAPRVEAANAPQHDYRVPSGPGDGVDEQDIPLDPSSAYPALRTGLQAQGSRDLVTRVVRTRQTRALAIPAQGEAAARLVLAVPTVRQTADGDSVLSGVASAELSWPDIFLLATPRSSHAYRLTLADASQSPPRLLLGGAAPLNDVQESYAIELGGQTLVLTYSATYSFMSEHQSLTAWFVLVFGLLFAALLNALTLISTGRTEFVQRLVELKTEEAEGLARDLATIVESAADGILSLDAQGRVRPANSAAARLLGQPVSALTGQPVRDLLGDELPDGIGDAAADRIDNAYTRFEQAGGPAFPAEFSCAPIAGDDGASQGQVIVFRDISERENFIAELSRANEELERFAFAASHDLQEPLRLIANFNALLERRYGDRLDEDGRTFIQHSIDAATRMQTLIADLLTYGKVEHEAQSPRSRVDLGGVIADVLKNLENTLNTAEGEVRVGEMPVVSGIPSQLNQVFQNLIGNALKYRRPDTQPVITVRCEDAGDDWKLEVCDNGIGIQPQYAEMIFEPFKRLHGKTEFSGTGMGLAICRKIVESHDGVIWVEANPEGGSCFLFTLPKADTDSDAPEQDPD